MKERSPLGLVEGQFAQAFGALGIVGVKASGQDIGPLSFQQLFAAQSEQAAGGAIDFDELTAVIGDEDRVHAALEEEAEALVAFLQGGESGGLLNGIADDPFEHDWLELVLEEEVGRAQLGGLDVDLGDVRPVRIMMGVWMPRAMASRSNSRPVRAPRR